MEQIMVHGYVTLEYSVLSLKTGAYANIPDPADPEIRITGEKEKLDEQVRDAAPDGERRSGFLDEGLIQIRRRRTPE